MPALPTMLGHVARLAPDCPLTDVTSVKAAVLDEVRDAGLLDRFVGGHPMAGTAHSGWAAGDAGLFVGAPWVVSVDDHVDPQVWADGDDAGAGLRRLRRPGPRPTSTTPPPPRSRTCRTCSPRRWPSPPRRSRWRSRWPRAPSGTAPGSPPPRRTWCGRCARPTPPSCCPPSTRRSICSPRPAQHLAERRARWPTWSTPATPPAPATTASAATEIVDHRHRRRRTGATNWPPPAARAG